MSTDPATSSPTSNDLLDPKKNVRALTRIIVLIVILLGGAWLLLRYTLGQRAANTAVAVITHQPLDLRNSIENVQANSVQWIGFRTPYTGTLIIEAAVMKGNDLDVFVVPASQVDKIRQKQQFSSFTEFSAEKTHTYRRSARLAAGDYALILRDKTLGVLSARSTDVKTHIRLEP
jgi:hypothetical protein